MKENGKIRASETLFVNVLFRTDGDVDTEKKSQVEAVQLVLHEKR